MSSVQRLVSPKLPTTLANDTRIDLPGHDVTILYVDQVHVIPSKLDLSKFEDALSSVLQAYPHAAGQLRCVDGRWSIELTNTAVPLAVDNRLNTTSESLLDGSWVIQSLNHLSPLLNQHPSGFNVVNSSEPLLRFKLTLLDHETCVGVSWNHSIGDAIMMSRFMHVLSQFYQDLPAEFTAPTFKKHHLPVPSASMLAELSSRMPLYRLGHFDEVAFAKSRKDLEEVRWRFDNRDLGELCSLLGTVWNDGKHLSKQDCLTAYLVAVLNYSENNQVQVVRNVSSYRHVNAPFISENMAGNLLLIISSDVPENMAGIASSVRDALVQSREPRFLEILASWFSQHSLEAANAGKLFPFLPRENEFAVNSHAVIDWRSAHFGCPDGARFHTHGVHRHFARCFRSNPARGDSGEWHTTQSIDISMGVSAEVKPKVMDTLARGIQYMLANESVRS